jgi:hypothetical protein
MSMQGGQAALSVWITGGVPHHLKVLSPPASRSFVVFREGGRAIAAQLYY